MTLSVRLTAESSYTGCRVLRSLLQPEEECLCVWTWRMRSGALKLLLGNR